MIYGYIRVSTDKQTVDNQRFEIERFCERDGHRIDRWLEETVSGGKEPEKRKLGGLLKKLKAGDILICSELSRLGRTLMMVMEILNHCLKRDVQVWTLKDNYRLGADISSKVLAFAFGLAAEIERNLISQRTKDALKLRVAQGVRLGRPPGRKSKSVKCTGHEEDIVASLKKGMSTEKIARRCRVNRATLSKFIKENGLYAAAGVEPHSNQRSPLWDNEEEILHLIATGWRRKAIAEHFGVHEATLNAFIRKQLSHPPEPDETLISAHFNTRSPRG